MSNKDKVIKSLESYIEMLHEIGLKNGSQEKMCRNAIDFIQSQSAEIERLKEMVGDR